MSTFEINKPILNSPFEEPADVHDIAVKVIDNRGNELLVVRSLDEAE